MKSITILFAAALLPASLLPAQVPGLIPQQGRVAVNGVNFEGTGQFKFALVNGAGTVTYWSNDGTSAAGSQPAAAVSLPVTKGLYSVSLGDTALTNMTAVPASVFANADLRVRVWFNNGTLGFQQLTPDQRLAPNGYVADGAVSTAKFAPGAVLPAMPVTGTQQTVVPNTNYVATGSGPTAFTLPQTAHAGDVVQISGSGSGTLGISDPTGWTARHTPSQWTGLVYAGSSGLIGCDAGGQLHFSQNNGETWALRGPALGWGAAASSADGVKLVAVSPGSGIYTSTDSGVTWVLRKEDSSSWSAAASSADGVKLVAVCNSGPAGGRIYTSTDSGVTWIQREPAGTWMSVASSDDGVKLVAGSLQGRIHTSTDSGVTWVPREEARSWRAVASSSDGNRLIAAASNGEGIYISTDAGISWTPRLHSGGWWAAASSADGQKLLAGENSGRLHVSEDGGATWKARGQSGLFWRVAAVSRNGDRMAAAVSNGRIYTSGAAYNTDGGETAQFVYGAAGWTLTTPAGMSLRHGMWTQKALDVYRDSGNVGIQTAHPRHLLTLGGGPQHTKIAFQDSLLGQPNGLGSSGGQFRLHLGNDQGRFSFLNFSDGAELMTIQGGGRVGIGTTTPASALHVNGVITGDGSGLTNVNASGLSGQLTAGQLPASVALRQGGNAFQGSQTIASSGNFNQPQLLLTQSNPADWSRLRMQSSGPAWDIALGPGASPQMNFYNGSSNILTLGQNGDATLQRNLNFTTGPLRQMVNMWNAEHGMGVQAWTTYFRTIGGATPGAFVWYRGGVHADAQYDAGAGGNELMRLTDGGLTVKGAFVSSSDRNVKQDFRPVNVQEVLEKVAALPVSHWSYKADPDTPHIGPMAQDFRAAFGTGADDKHIATVDADGVALAAIKGLHEKLKDKDAEISRLREETRALREAMGRQNAALEERLRDLERRVNSADSANFKSK